jgi:hypothetical protein
MERACFAETALDRGDLVSCDIHRDLDFAFERRVATSPLVMGGIPA